jgi:precorrin-6B methylase 2
MSFNQIKETLIRHSVSGKTDKASCHAYEFFYPSELKYLSLKPQDQLNILEIGTATGGSLRCWMELYPSAKFYAIDHTPEMMDEDVRNDTRLSIIRSKQANGMLRSAFSDVSFDLIIDDASHAALDQMESFSMFKDRLALGGKYIIEDIYPENVYPPEFKSQFRIVDITSIKNRGDDILFVYEKNV